MDRFIAQELGELQEQNDYLKSNMDRFIGCFNYLVINNSVI